jgi:hypothetical protein
MSWDEHIMLIAHTVNVYGDRLKVRMGSRMQQQQNPAGAAARPSSSSTSRSSWVS